MELDDLIAQVHGDDPLSRLGSAMGVKADLDDLADDLIGHFVEGARNAGHSWSEIGAAMGVTKQAAQQRHATERPTRPWRFGQRWTPRAKNVVREAHASAADLGHSHLGTVHLLLGMLAVPEGIAGKILSGAGVTRESLVAGMTEPAGKRRGHLRQSPFTPNAKSVVASSVDNALRLSHNYVGTEHLLLAVFDVPDSAAAKALADAGLTKALVARRAVELVKGAA